MVGLEEQQHRAAVVVVLVFRAQAAATRGQGRGPQVLTTVQRAALAALLEQLHLVFRAAVLAAAVLERLQRLMQALLAGLLLLVQAAVVVGEAKAPQITYQAERRGALLVTLQAAAEAQQAAY